MEFTQSSFLPRSLLLIQEQFLRSRQGAQIAKRVDMCKVIILTQQTTRNYHSNLKYYQNEHDVFWLKLLDALE